MENAAVQKDEKKSLLESKSTYLILILIVAFLLNLLGGEVSVMPIIGTLIGSIIFAYPICYIFQAVRYRRLNVGNKQTFELRVLQTASVFTFLVFLSTLMVA